MAPRSKAPSAAASLVTRLGLPCLAIALVGSLVGCTTEPEAPAPEPRRGSFSDTYEADASSRPERDIDPTSLRNMSELLAGMTPTEERDQLEPVWLDHAEKMDAIWQGIDERHSKMRAWAAASMTEIGDPEAPLVYPFGGPDLTSVMQFFDRSSFYLLMGLEGPGRLPMPEAFSGAALAADLERLRSPFKGMVTSGYFVRSEIDKGLSGGNFDGILPILLICLVRDGQIPTSLDYVTLDPETFKVVPLPAEEKVAKAIKVSFLDRATADRVEQARIRGEAADPADLAQIRSVYYFSQDLSNDGFYTDDPLSRLIERQTAINVYVKGGEYLLHTPAFTNLRDLILAQTQSLLQDDSGLPVRFLKSNRWQVHLFGQYREVLAAYKPWFQEDLAAAFAKHQQVSPLGFNLGYNSTTDGGCLILAERRADAEPHQKSSQPAAG